MAPNNGIGIDISHYQSSVPAGSWLFVVHQATEGRSFTDPTFAARFPSLKGLRGAYHYSRPAQTDGATQANRFADTVLAAGFKPSVDLWQLDAEDGENAGVLNWRVFIQTFMRTASKRLGRRGFLYAGWPFILDHNLEPLVEQYHWWLPDYGPNDGALHAAQTPPQFARFLVLHQFSSAGSLDRNVVANHARWNRLLASPHPELTRKQTASTGGEGGSAVAGRRGMSGQAPAVTGPRRTHTRSGALHERLRGREGHRRQVRAGPFSRQETRMPLNRAGSRQGACAATG